MARTPHYWFNRRNLGQLLVPVTWQAFVLIAIQAVILVGGLKVVLDADSTSGTIGYCVLFGFLMFLTFAVAISKSPMPRWLRHSLGD
jgi:hypothetical protein